ncbi:cyclin-dependent kinase inhibitor 3 isoform X3 [Nycticebus coucang]|uniref:cyclin-dependent kinase inhibitor 3 isoform X3 n=1 Tax=Nycticebus coucang TaxID=9470 RepID=UPI00234CC63B|nr:cyclin-dependent kinase inhibitor 3 isoform X3 [Nycticebus coucang]
MKPVSPAGGGLEGRRRRDGTSPRGCKFKDTRRNIQKDTEELKSCGIQDIFVFCTRGELSKYRVPNLLDLYQQHGITTHHHPIPDGGTPDIASCCEVLEELAVCLKNGRKTLLQSGSCKSKPRGGQPHGLRGCLPGLPRLWPLVWPAVPGVCAYTCIYPGSASHHTILPRLCHHRVFSSCEDTSVIGTGPP